MSSPVPSVVRGPIERARLVVRGAERVEFVNRMCTNDVRLVDERTAVAAALTSAKGRIVDLVRVFARGDELVLLGSDGSGERLVQWLQKYVVMEELAIEDSSARDGSLLVLGPNGEKAVERVLGVAPRSPGPAKGLAVVAASFGGAAVHAIGPGAPPIHGIELVAPAALVGELRAKLLEAGLAPVDGSAWESLRVELGIPHFGRELTENVNPLEASLGAAVSFEKGCYIGQEVVARLNSYSKVQRHLVGVKFPASVDPAAAHELFVDLLRVGHVSSAVRSTRLDATLALAFVKNEYSKAGTAVYTVREGEHLPGVLAELPFPSSS
jgi:folate-binding protein YgfZ